MKSIIKSKVLFSCSKLFQWNTGANNDFPLQNYLAGSLGIISAVAPHFCYGKYSGKSKQI